MARNKSIKLTIEEQEILNEYEKGNFKSIPNVKEEIVKYTQYAKYTLNFKVNNFGNNFRELYQNLKPFKYS